MVGQAIQALLGDQSHSFSHLTCDVTDAEGVESIIAAHTPKAVFNGAAITNVDLCETDHALADRVNVQGVINLARSCQRHGATLIHFSTDYVFDGGGDTPFAEDHPRNPINYYGRGKAASEEHVQAICPDHIIARVQWVFGPGRHNFISDAATKLQRGEAVRAFADQYGAPTYAHDIATMVRDLYRGGQRGLFHTVNAGHANRVEIAQEIARQLHVSTPEIIPVRTAHISLPARRPLNSRLSIDKISKLGIHPPTWQDAIARYLKTL